MTRKTDIGAYVSNPKYSVIEIAAHGRSESAGFTAMQARRWMVDRPPYKLVIQSSCNAGHFGPGTIAWELDT